MKRWKKLSENNTICIIAPAFGVANYEQIEKAIQSTIQVVTHYKLVPLMYDNMLSPGNHTLFNSSNLIFANTDEVRFDHLIRSLKDSLCHAVWCFRGGYGTIRLIKYLESQEEPLEVKPFIGYSDITILHSYFNIKWGWPTLHFGMPGVNQANMLKQENILDLQQLLFATTYSVIFKLIKINDVDINQSKYISGTTCGGNLVNFIRTFGTEFQPNLSDKVLFLEEFDIEPRLIDGLLQQLQLTTNFTNINAIVFGSFLPLEDKITYEKIITDFSADIDIPVFKLFDKDTIGHGEVNKVLPMGTQSTIKLLEQSYYEMRVDSGVLDLQDLFKDEL